MQDIDPESNRIRSKSLKSKSKEFWCSTITDQRDKLWTNPDSIDDTIVSQKEEHGVWNTIFW